MEFFPDGGFVRLQNRGNERYLHADGDWVGVTTRPLSPVPSLESVWRVEHWVSGRGPVFLLLQSAAYGRYLFCSIQPAPPGHLGLRVFQRDYDDPNLVDAFLWRWRAQRVYPDQPYVRLRHFHFDLRANGRFLTWNNRVTVDAAGGREITTMMQWTVHAVAATPVPIPLPVTPPEPHPQIQEGRRGWAWWRSGYGPGVYPQVPREVRHVRANDEGDFDQNHFHWHSFISFDQTVFDLRIFVGQLQADWNGDMLAFTLCMRPGSHGRLMPLATHLPRSGDTLRIVVFRTGSPAAVAFVYPQIHPPAQ